MNPAKLACLINDTIDGIEQSKLGGIACRDKDGNILRDSNGYIIYNTISVQILQSAVQAQLMGRAINYEN